jgi:hypothetical protein
MAVAGPAWITPLRARTRIRTVLESSQMMLRCGVSAVIVAPQVS